MQYVIMVLALLALVVMFEVANAQYGMGEYTRWANNNGRYSNHVG